MNRNPLGLALLGLAFATAASAAPSIEGLEEAAVTRSNLVVVHGADFGTEPGVVTVDGHLAPVSSWSDGRIGAYVPEATALGPATLVVKDASGVSDSATLEVLDRTPSGPLAWSFRMDGIYSFVRPVIGPSGTVYVVDVYEHLYALSPSGELLWLANDAGNKGVAVASDGTVYACSENDVKAYAPDGRLLWTLVQDPRAYITQGIGVGPDDNLYVVSTNGMGIFSLTPDGDLRWQLAETYSRPIELYSEVVIGPHGAGDQLFFSANAHTRGVDLDGSHRFYFPGGLPDIAADGTLYWRGFAYSPDGALLHAPSRSIPLPLDSTITPDETSYVLSAPYDLWSVSSTGIARNRMTLEGYHQTVEADPTGGAAVTGGGTASDVSYVQYIDTATWSTRWRYEIPDFQGLHVWAGTAARFRPDGEALYLTAYTVDVADSPNSPAFVYAFDPDHVAGNAPPVAIASASVTQGPPPLNVDFDGTASYDPDGAISTYEWDFGDATGLSGATTFHQYGIPGTYAATLTVTDGWGARDTTEIVIRVDGNGCASVTASPVGTALVGVVVPLLVGGVRRKRRRP